MVKIQTEIAQGQYDVLCSVAKKIGLPVKKLIQQEVEETLNNACAWIERGQL